jgi:hypothetical protein
VASALLLKENVADSKDGGVVEYQQFAPTGVQFYPKP